MDHNVNFHRFDRNTKTGGFGYNSTDKVQTYEHELQAISMSRAGFNLHYNVRNYLAEPVMLGGNLRATPTRINSLMRDDNRLSQDFNNTVIITIYSTEITTSPDPKKKVSHSHKTEIRIPGKMLNKGSVFIDELDCYIMTESQIDATRELIARDIMHQNWDSINIPQSMVKQDPPTMYTEFKDLVKQCILQQDQVSIRIGVDLKKGEIPDIIKTMHISILDSYFVPSTSYKLVYDPTLDRDEFVIENLSRKSRMEFRSTFSELEKSKVIYLDYDEVKTMFGTFYGMGIFANKAVYADYVYQRRTIERFDEEQLFVAHRSGDPRLKEEIARLEREMRILGEGISEKDEILVLLKETIRTLKTTLTERENTITQIRKHHDAKMSAEAVIGDIANERLKLGNDKQKIENERVDIDYREKAAPLAHRATMLKTIGDILKSTWGIITAILGGLLSVAALCKKYDIKLVMGG